jgi:chromosome segregation ATPase
MRVEELVAQLARSDADRLAKQGEIERLRAAASEYQREIRVFMEKVERLRERNEWQAETLESLARRITRLRKAVNWLIGALENAPEPSSGMGAYRTWRREVLAWEVKRGRAVLEEEAE